VRIIVLKLCVPSLSLRLAILFIQAKYAVGFKTDFIRS
jgi:hypothetical protein